MNKYLKILLKIVLILLLQKIGLMLTSVGKNQSPFPKPEALKEPGVLGLASSLVQADKEYEGLIRYLLGRVVVADTIDHAIAIARKYHYSLRIVTLEGELLNAGGSMTGGAFKNTSNLLGRRREIEELEAACKKALEQVEAVQKELAETGRRLTEAKRTLASVQERRQQMQIQQNTLELTICQLEARRQEIADSSQDLSSENQELELQVGDLRGALRELQTEETKLETLSNEKNQYVEEQQTGLETAKKQRGEAAAALSEIQLGHSQAEQKGAFIEENLRRVLQEQERLRAEKEKLSGGHADSSETIAAREREIAALEAEIQASGDKRTQMELVIQNKQREKEEKAGRQKTFFDKKEELNERLQLLDRENFRLQNQRERLNERLESQVDYMWSEYELTYSRAEELRKEALTSIPEMKRSINEIGRAHV